MKTDERTKITMAAPEHLGKQPGDTDWLQEAVTSYNNDDTANPQDAIGAALIDIAVSLRMLANRPVRRSSSNPMPEHPRKGT